MRSPSPSRSTSEYQGRAATLCPPLIGHSLAKNLTILQLSHVGFGFPARAFAILP
jgi:hypothetical protein